MKLKISVFIFILLLAFACTVEGTRELEYDILTKPLQTGEDKASLYLDIPNQTIFNTSVHMQYSLDNGNNWTDCEGAVTKVSLSGGEQVLVRDKSDYSWVRNLGTVDALSDAPDLFPGGRLYIGYGSWADYIVVKPGDLFNILSYCQNNGNASSVTNYHIRYYLSDDKNITDSDTLLYNFTYALDTPLGEIPLSDPYDFEITVPAVPPGIYYVGIILDYDSEMLELNENNNTTLPEDTAILIISDSSVPSSGAMKIVNSWGTGSWGQNVTGDGHYWMPYEVMKNNHMPVFFYMNETSYKPTVLAVFQIRHPDRNALNIRMGLGDPDDPVIFKEFQIMDWSGNPLGGDQDFPENKMVMDITEFAYAINDYDFFIEIDNYSVTSGTLVNFSVEFYDDFSSGTPFAFFIWGDSTSIPARSISAPGNLTMEPGRVCTLNHSQLESISPPVQSKFSAAGSFNLEKPGSSEISRDILSLGVYQEGLEYNKLYKGKYGTGYKPPTISDWNKMLKLRSISYGSVKASFDGITLPDNVDNSAEKFFPPIGDQGGKGSCAAFSVGYYIQTYTEAKERGWDLSSVSWGTDITGVSESGSPDSSLDKIFSPDFIYHLINGGKDNGAFIGNAMEVVLRHGGATLSTMPYVNKWIGMTESDYSHWPSEAAWREAPQYRGDAWGSYFWTDCKSGYFIIEDDSDIQMLKSLLNKGYIVSTGIHTGTTYENLDSHDVVDSAALWYGDFSIDHAQTIVGYKEGSSWNPLDPDA